MPEANCPGRPPGRATLVSGLRRSGGDLLLAGCQDTEYSWDTSFQGRPNGAFTYYALKTLRERKPATYDAWFNAIRDLPAQYPPAAVARRSWARPRRGASRCSTDGTVLRRTDRHVVQVAVDQGRSVRSYGKYPTARYSLECSLEYKKGNPPWHQIRPTIRGTTQSTAPRTADIGITNPRRVVPGVGRRPAWANLEAARGRTGPGDPGQRLRPLDPGRRPDAGTRPGDPRPWRRGGLGDRLPACPISQAQRAAGPRGWLGLGIQVLEFFGVDLKGQTAARWATSWSRSCSRATPRGSTAAPWATNFSPDADPRARGLPADQGPILVFLHGTGSSCQGSFGELWEADGKAPAARERPCGPLRRPGLRLGAPLAHRRAPSATPSNWRERLPDGRELHLVSHSRGGLVGELLCLGERDQAEDPLQARAARGACSPPTAPSAEQLGLSPLDDEAAKDRDAAYAADRERLEGAAGPAGPERSPSVRRFVRVACPARGHHAGLGPAGPLAVGARPPRRRRPGGRCAWTSCWRWSRSAPTRAPCRAWRR